MKKTISILCSLCILCLSTNLTNAQGLTLGVRGGLNLANVSGDVQNNKDLIGVQLGGILNYAFNEHLSLQPEVLYSAKGYKVDIAGSTLKVNLNYIEIPVAVKYSLGSGLNFSAGPYLGVLMSAKSDGKDIKDNLNTTDIGLGFGVGYHLESGLGFDLRYALGMTDIDKADNSSIKNTAIGLSVHYMFGGK